MNGVEAVVKAVYAHWVFLAMFSCILSGACVRIMYIVEGSRPEKPIQCAQFLMVWFAWFFLWPCLIPTMCAIGIASGIYLLLFCRLWDEISSLFAVWKNHRMAGQEDAKRYKEIIAELENELEIVRRENNSGN